MKAKLFFIVILLTVLPFQRSRGQVLLETTTVDTSTLIYGLDIPWEILWGPDNHIWATERFGRVSRIDPLTGSQDVILDISGIVEQAGESGLLGMALHPNFADTPYVYLAYTYLQGSDIKERIVSYEYNGTNLSGESILLDNIRGNYNHDGCRLIISPDRKLFITTGDALLQAAAQDIDDLSGKVLRINLDGSIPADNPFPGNPVWTWGHRNAQGLHLAPNGILYSSEHGPNTDDELNIIEKARNYGWPNVHGFCDLPDEMTFCEANNVVEPLIAWTPTIATSDILWFDHPAIPEWEGSILLTTLKNKRIYELEMDVSGTSVVNTKQWFIDYWGRLRDICLAPDGTIYLATNGPSASNTEPFTHRIVKVWNPEATGDIPDPKRTARLLQVFPNPMHDSAIVNTKDFIGGNYFLRNVEGVMMWEGRINSDGLILKKGPLKAGIYILTCQLRDVESSVKIIVR